MALAGRGEALVLIKYHHALKGKSNRALTFKLAHFASAPVAHVKVILLAACSLNKSKVIVSVGSEGKTLCVMLKALLEQE